MITNLKLFLSAAATFAVLDYIWLGMIMSGFYTKEMLAIGRILDGKIKPVLWSGAIVYILLALGIVFFVLPKIEVGAGLFNAFVVGAFFGLIVYGVYDWTNYAVLKDYSLLLSVVDMAWGAIVSGAAAVVSVYVRNHLT